jgi:hypothetical protein
MDWDQEIEQMLDRFNFRGKAREMMRANMMKLPPNKRAAFVKKQPEEYSRGPKRTSAPQAVVAAEGPRRHMKVQSSNVPCEACGEAVEGRLFFIDGGHFEDSWQRGYFCTAECLQMAFEVEHYGSPHSDFMPGDEVRLMFDTHLLTADDRSDLHLAGTACTVVSEQRFHKGLYAAGAYGDLEVSWKHVVIDVRCEGQVYTDQYVSSFLFVRRD